MGPLLAGAVAVAVSADAAAGADALCDGANSSRSSTNIKIQRCCQDFTAGNSLINNISGIMHQRHGQHRQPVVELLEVVCELLALLGSSSALLALLCSKYEHTDTALRAPFAAPQRALGPNGADGL